MLVGNRGTRQVVKISIRLLGLAPLLLMDGCSLGECRGTRTVMLKLVNGGSEAVHIWVGGEEMGPTNRLAGGQSRQKSLEVRWFDDIVTNQGELDFVLDTGSDDPSAQCESAKAQAANEPQQIQVFAGRNGALIATGTVTVEYDRIATYVVTWNGSSFNVSVVDQDDSDLLP